MTRAWIAAGLLALAPLLIAPSCGGADKFRNQRNMLGVIELGPFPKQAPGVGGYNLYMGKTKEGDFEKLNLDGPVLGHSRLMVPMLEPGKDYFFKMTSVSAKDPSKESAPGGVFKRTASEKAQK
jgi:hypothetical protein